jgi:hypothetical protein
VKKKGMTSEAAKVIGSLKDAQELVDGVFSPFDNALPTLNDSTKKKFAELLGDAEEKVKQMGGEKLDWWLSEVYLRKARCAGGILEKPQEHHAWKRAYEFGVKSNNHEVSVQSSFELGFSLVEFTTSIREILEIQMNCVRAICKQGAAIHSRLRIIGINLYDFWSQLEFRRLSESDLKAKQFVLDGAKSLKEAGFDDDKAAPIMILLISNVFDFDDPAIEWAKLETAILDIPIPEEVKSRIASSLPTAPG